MEDSQIIQLYWQRDEEAIPATSQKYSEYCFSIARGIVGSREDAEECVNDTWLRVWNAIPPQRPQILRVFLGRIARNLSLNRYRKNTALRRGGAGADAILDELAECVSGRDDPQTELELRELTAELGRFVRELAPVRRDIFLRRYWYADSIPDIAVRFGRTENNIYVILSRTRAELKQHMQERGYEL